MYSTYVWHKFHLYRAKIIVIVSFLLVILTVKSYAQPRFQRRFDYNKRLKTRDQSNINLPTYDKRLLHYGFYIGLNHSRFRAVNSQFFADQISDLENPNPIAAIKPRGGTGLTVGFILNLRVADNFDLRALPNVVFFQRSVDFHFGKRTLGQTAISGDSIVTHLNQTTFSFVELPILLKFKSDRRQNMRMYVLAGIKPALEVGSYLSKVDDSFLRSNTNDFSLDYGFGAELYYPMFKFSPEIRFSHGVNNMRFPDSNIYARSIKSLFTHTVTLYFNFE